MTDEYPDFTQPKDQGSEYPDFTQPKVSQDAPQPLAQPNNDEGFLSKVGRAYSPFVQNEKELYRRLYDKFPEAAGIATMLIGPEAKLPGFISSKLPQLSGAKKIAADYLSNIGKVGASGYLGEKMIPGSTEEDAQKTAAIGAGIAGVTTPAAMFLANRNPLVRMLAGGLLGGTTGYGLSNISGVPGLSSLGGVAGAVLGMRGGGNTIAELAAKNVNNALSPDQISQAAIKEEAGNRIGIPMTLAEKTGSPVLAGMQEEAARSVPGSKVLYPFAQRRQVAEEKAISDLLNKVSPPNVKGGLENRSFNRAFNQKTQVDVNPVVAAIDRELPKYEEGSQIARGLKQAKERLRATPQTIAAQNEKLRPINNLEEAIQPHFENASAQLKQLQENAPEPYFRQSSGYDEKVNALKSQLAQYQQIKDQAALAKENVARANNFSEFEQTVEGLHNAKMGIRGLIEGQGDEAIGQTAAGKLKRIDRMLTNQIKNASPQYAEATRISNLRQARDEIQSSMAKSELTGSDFYRNVLQNKDEFKRLHARLGDPRNPKQITPAQQALSDMQLVLPDLLSNLTAKSGKGTEKAGKALSIDFAGIGTSLVNKMFMDRYNQAIAELMVNPNWQAELHKIANEKAGETRGARLSRLLSSVSMSVGSASNNS